MAVKTLKILAAMLVGTLMMGPSTPRFAAAEAEEGWDEEAGSRADPLVSFNEKMFWFNLRLDDYVLRPAAIAYDKVIPDAGKRGVDRFFKNLGIVERLANNLFQRKFRGAGAELGRFTLNTTLGVAGFLDVADRWFGLKESNEDFGQTLGTYGVEQGAYLVLPFWGPSTVRDAFGLAVDSAMNPMNYLLSTTEVLAARGGIVTGRAVNYRSLNLELFADVDRYAVDLYGAVQDVYMQRREKEVVE